MSDSVALHGFGGGTGLNYMVKAYASEELRAVDTPRENTIGIITETEITSHVFSLEEPANREEGMIWIMTGLFSPAPFSVTRHNSVMVYPEVAKQFVSGQWHDKNAKTYQDEEWIDWAQYLVKDGKLIASHECSDSMAVTEGNGSLHIHCASGNGEYVSFRNVDMTGRTKLTAEGTFSANNTGSRKLCVWQNDQTDCIENTSLASALLSEATVVISVEELTGLHKVGFICAAAANEYVTDLYVS